MIDRLRQRRDQILVLIGASSMDSFPHNAGLRDLTGELATIESALIQAENTRAIQSEAASRDRERASADDASFWFRRFMLSLQVGNGAALLAALSGALQADDPVKVMKLVHSPVVAFGFGIIAAGLLPGVLWIERAVPQARMVARLAIGLLTAVSAGAFLYGVAYIQG